MFPKINNEEHEECSWFVFGIKATLERKNGPYPCYKINRLKNGSRSAFFPKNRVISCNLHGGLGVVKPQTYSAKERRVSLNRIFQTTLACLLSSRCRKNGSSNYSVALIVTLIDICELMSANNLTPLSSSLRSEKRNIRMFVKYRSMDILRSSLDKKIPSFYRSNGIYTFLLDCLVKITIITESF